ncbi:MAG: outer membrane beta-barrel protein [Candidatus Omnitrophica bacterium]|jgi:hypothetical protein|nr:outer membrane beta-barrel protein [Candidatus Omnitrophota bacterium]
MRIKLASIPLFFSICLVFSAHTPYCQLKEEKEEKSRAINIVPKLPPDYKFSSRLNLFVGYDTNVNLSPVRTKDVYEEILYSFNLSKKFDKTLNFTFDYDLDYLNYNKVTDASSLLNHFRLGMHKEISTFTTGAGYDLGVFYYPHNDDEDFLFHKAFAYIKHKISKNFYHKLQLEAGLKNYTDRKALADTINTYQDDNRTDTRASIEYKIGSNIIKKLIFALKLKATVNDSNVSYVDFYDYESYEGALNFDYQLAKRLYLISNLSYVRKIFDERVVTSRSYKERDSLYTGTLGFSYQMNKQNDLSVYYTYRQNSSNDNIAEYSESVINCGWQYYF